MSIQTDVIRILLNSTSKKNEINKISRQRKTISSYLTHKQTSDMSNHKPGSSQSDVVGILLNANQYENKEIKRKADDVRKICHIQLTKNLRYA